eukprot:6213436-Pleurochrysis_carterae.AAC.8
MDILWTFMIGAERKFVSDRQLQRTERRRSNVENSALVTAPTCSTAKDDDKTSKSSCTSIF